MLRNVGNNTDHTVLVGHTKVLMHSVGGTLVESDVVLRLVDAVADHMGDQITILVLDRIVLMEIQGLILLQLLTQRLVLGFENSRAFEQLHVGLAKPEIARHAALRIIDVGRNEIGATEPDAPVIRIGLA